MRQNKNKCSTRALRLSIAESIANTNQISISYTIRKIIAVNISRNLFYYIACIEL